jgi:hypothetical protein
MRELVVPPFAAVGVRRFQPPVLTAEADSEKETEKQRLDPVRNCQQRASEAKDNDEEEKEEAEEGME